LIVVNTAMTIRLSFRINTVANTATSRNRLDPTSSPYVDQALAMAKFDPGMYEVVKVFAGPSMPAR